jgi:serine/threonine protein kinase
VVSAFTALDSLPPCRQTDCPTIELLPTLELLAMESPMAQPDSEGDLMPGVVLRSRYVLEEVIGRGGHSLVFRAKDLHRVSAEDPDGSHVALKVLRSAQSRNERAMTRLAREFRQMQRLSHPGIARVFDLDCDGDIWFVTMELVRGQTLTEWLRQSPGVGSAMQVIGAICEASGYAHSMGIVHGDLKPSNVLLTADLEIKLIDFGSVAVPSRDVSAATPLYASPQVLAGMPAEARDDIFSLACLSYGLLSEGQRPFGDLSSLDAHRARLCPAAIPGMPVEVFAVLARNLAGDREQRSHSAEEFHRELLAPAPELKAHHSRRPLPEHRAPEHRAPDYRAQQTLRRVSLASVCAAAVCAVTLLLPTARKIVAGTGDGSSSAVHEASAQVAHIASAAYVAARDPALAPSVSAAATMSSNAPAAFVSTRVGEDTAADGSSANGGSSRRAAGVVTFESAALAVGSAQSLIAIPIRRTQSTRGTATVEWQIESGSAMPDVDYHSVKPQVVRFNEGETARSLFIPLVRPTTDVRTRSARTFTVTLKPSGDGPRLGALTRVRVTILPQPVFTDIREAVAASSLPNR